MQNVWEIQIVSTTPLCLWCWPGMKIHLNGQCGRNVVGERSQRTSSAGVIAAELEAGLGLSRDCSVEILLPPQLLLRTECCDFRFSEIHSTAFVGHFISISMVTRSQNANQWNIWKLCWPRFTFLASVFIFMPIFVREASGTLNLFRLIY